MAKQSKPKKDVVLEENARFSESILWQLQQSAYTQFGIEAWRQKGVPFYITSNPFTAKQYAHVVMGYLRDCLKSNSCTPIELSEPVHIFDLGAGTGRFGFMFLKQLHSLLSELALQKVKIRYVMTDIVESNIGFLRKHPYLQDFIREGMLDFAFYHHAQCDKPLELIISKESLSSKTLKNPIIVIGNYFFDTIPQDLFKVQNGSLLEGRVSISAPVSKNIGALEPANPAVIKEMRCTYTYLPLPSRKPYYHDPKLNTILEAYTKSFENVPFLFPVGAFASIRYFMELSKGRLLLVAGDQGVCTEDQISKWGEPHIARHGSFSISVSYHAIAAFFRNLGGVGLLTTYPDPMFVVLSAVLGGGSASYPETRSAFRTNIDAFEPSDYWKIVTCTEEEWQTPSLEYILMLLKLGNWDPMNLNAFYNAIRMQIPGASEALKERLSQTIHNIWANFYPISIADGDFLLNLGVLFFDMKRYNDALLFFQRSLEVTGEKAAALKNIGACYMALHDVEKAFDSFQKAKAVEP